MEHPLGPLTPEEEMLLETGPQQQQRPLVENAAPEAMAPVGVDRTTLQQQQATESDRRFRMLAEQQRAAIDQVLAGQAGLSQLAALGATGSNPYHPAEEPGDSWWADTPSGCSSPSYLGTENN